LLSGLGPWLTNEKYRQKIWLHELSGNKKTMWTYKQDRNIFVMKEKCTEIIHLETLHTTNMQVF
jgi:hypothetical protein